MLVNPSEEKFNKIQQYSANVKWLDFFSFHLQL